MQANIWEKADSWEEWELYSHDEGAWVTLKAHTGNFLLASPDGTIAANQILAEYWERWNIVDCPDGFKALQSVHSGYLSSRGVTTEAGNVISFMSEIKHAEQWLFVADPKAFTSSLQSKK